MAVLKVLREMLMSCLLLAGPDFFKNYYRLVGFSD